MLHSDLFPEFGYDGELIELSELHPAAHCYTMRAKCWTELSWLADDGRWVSVVYPGMKQSMDWRT